jgi:peroxiredoxin Q/BCP
MELGSHIPDMTLLDQSGSPVALRSLAGAPLVLYFYPKDMTPGCTIEAEQFRDAFAQFTEKGAVIVGVSPDLPVSHEKFCTAYDLPFTLLSDSEHTLAEVFGVWVEKSMYGKKYWGIERTTFLFGADGTLAHVFSKVKPDGHAQAVLAAL